MIHVATVNPFLESKEMAPTSKRKFDLGRESPLSRPSTTGALLCFVFPRVLVIIDGIKGIVGFEVRKC